MLGALRSRRAVWAQVFVTLALLAMTVRALIPQGYMLASPQDGRLISIQICSGLETTHAVLDLKTGAIVEQGAASTPGPPKQQKSDAPCVFAAIAHLSAPAFPILISNLVTSAAPVQFLVFAVAPGLGLAAPPPESTGPPAHD